MLFRSLAYLQIHAPHFLDNNETSIYIQNTDELVDEIEKTEGVVAASQRLVTEPFIMAAHGTGGGKLIGIWPEKEKNVTDISEHVIEGTYLEKSGRMPPVVIGEKLAKKLQLKIGSKINVQMVDLNGDLSSKIEQRNSNGQKKDCHPTPCLYIVSITIPTRRHQESIHLVCGQNKGICGTNGCHEHKWSGINIGNNCHAHYQWSQYYNCPHVGHEE